MKKGTESAPQVRSAVETNAARRSADTAHLGEAGPGGDESLAEAFAGGEREERADRLRALGTLTSNISHEFNNILMVIASSAEWARDTDDETSRKEALDLLLDATERGTELTSQLLAFGGGGGTAREPTDLGELLLRATGLLCRLLPKHIKVDAQFDPKLGRLLTNRIEVCQMLINLGLNSKDSMPDGGAITIKAHRGRADEHRSIELVVTDTGNGMSDRTRMRAFEPGFSTKGLQSGTGLGLSVVYGIVQRLRGKVVVDSEVGVGTAVTITLPVYDHGSLAPPSSRNVVRPGRETVLLVDDDPLVRVSIARVLRSAGYTVHEAENGLDALKAWERLDGGIDLVVSDSLLPHLGVPDLSRSLSDSNLDIPLLLCSGYQPMELDPSLIESPTRAVLTKPFSGQQLLQQVRQLLNRGRDDPPE